MERVETPAAAAVAVAPAMVEIDINAALEPTVPTVVPHPSEVVAAMPEIIQTPVVTDDDLAALNIVAEPVSEEVAEEVVEEVSQNEDLQGTEIASIKSAYWGSFLQVIETVSPGLGINDIISIDEGQLITTKDSGIIKCDLTSVFGKNSWNLKDPSLHLKILKLIKGGSKVTILETDNKNIIYNSADGVLKQWTAFTKPDAGQYDKVQETTLGDLKTKYEIKSDVVANLVAARAAYAAMYYNVTIDSETHEILSIDVDEKFKEVILPETGRETERYKLKELFPVKKADAIILEVYNKNGAIFIRTSNDFSLTTIYFQIAAIRHAKRNDLSADDI